MHHISPTLSSWTEDFFDEIYFNISKHTFPSDTALNLLKEVRQQTSNPVETFFDQCSGWGELSLQLAQQGLTGVAVEQSLPYVQQSKKALQQAGLSSCVEFVCADAGSFVPFPQDLSISWHTSLGYNGKEGALLLLRNLVSATKKDGLTVVDMRDLSTYQKEETTTKRPFVFEGKESVLHRQGTWDGQVLFQKWFVTQGSETIWEKPNTSCYHLSKKEMQVFAKEHHLDVNFVARPSSRLLVFLSKK